jgi:citrate lyase subunit beta/citryl-CoA lyase
MAPGRAPSAASIQPPLDGVTTDLNDPEVLRQNALRAKRFGFGGKLCIHPGQVATVNRIFSPADEEVSWAREVISAVDQSAAAVVWSVCCAWYALRRCAVTVLAFSLL